MTSALSFVRPFKDAMHGKVLYSLLFLRKNTLLILFCVMFVSLIAPPPEALHHWAYFTNLTFVFIVAVDAVAAVCLLLLFAPMILLVLLSLL